MNVSQYRRKSASWWTRRNYWRSVSRAAPQASNQTRSTSREDEDPEARKGGDEALGLPSFFSLIFIISVKP